MSEENDLRLDRGSAVQLYRQLEDLLCSEIENGGWPSGSRLPTENDLVAQYHVSRVTVRKALAELSHRGYLERKSGKGTFVAEKKIQRGLSGVSSFTEMCHVMGCEPGARTIKMSIEYPTPEEMTGLGIGEDSEILAMERIRYADGKAVVLEKSKFPESFFFLMSEDLKDASLYEVVKKHGNIVFTKSVKTLDIVYASVQEARFLNITKGYPLLRISSTVEDVTGQYRYLSQQLCIADKFKLMV